MTYNPHASVSGLLVDVRTIHSRTKTALLDAQRFPDNYLDEPGRMIDGKYHPGVMLPHPDTTEIIAALQAVAKLLEPWERTGR